jgi:UDP-N-acetylmuramoyl-tripeptide--D-alanyl-D-alanine ligase
MAKWRSNDILQALNLIIDGTIDFEASGISIDSRTINPKELFIAIKGENFDGHEFLIDALNKGAAGFIISQDPPSFLNDQTYFIVPDTLQALKQLADYARQRSTAQIIAITGSAGKTTTKEWLGQTLGHFGKTVYSPASYNNHFGVPLSLTSLDEDTAFGVFEIGMNNEGEIAPLSQLVQPDIAIITNITEAHIGQLNSLSNIAKEKSTIFAGLKPGGIAILNYDDTYFEFLADKAKEYGASKVISVGTKEGADIHLISSDYYSTSLTTQVEAKIYNQHVAYSLSLLGKHYIMNSLMVLAATDCLDIDLKKAIKEVEKLQPIAGRGQQHTLSIAPDKTITLIDDSYNAHASSMEAGLSTLAQIPLLFPNGRKIAVLGDMKELGEQSEELHKGLLPLLQNAKVDLLFACGPHMKMLLDQLPPSQRGGYSDHAEQLWQPLLDGLQNGDIVFIKGSKSTKVSLLVHRLLSLHQDILSSQLAVA